VAYFSVLKEIVNERKGEGNARGETRVKGGGGANLLLGS